MHDSLLETGECMIVYWRLGNARLLRYCGMLDLCVFKAGVEREVAFSPATTPAANEAKHIFLKYLAAGSREEGLIPEAPVCMYQSPMVSSLS